MKIIKAFPPNFAQLCRAFPIKGKHGLLYAWGDRIYNPSGVKVPFWLEAHEGLHGQRQRAEEGGPTQWWQRYLDEAPFRFHEELLAHQVEWSTFCDLAGRNDEERTLYLSAIAKRLSSPLYGDMISYEGAKARIVGERYA